MRINTLNNYPENCIFLGNPDTQAADAKLLISQMKVLCPEKFEGNRDSFSFELRYTAPFDKGFNELKRLQGTAAEAAGRRNEFKGYIVLDMNSWLTHHDEEYLNKALLFLIDMSDCWKYIFLVNNQNSKAARELVGRILSVFFRGHILCKVREEPKKCSYRERVNALCKEEGVVCSTFVKEFLQELLEMEFDETIVSALLSEISRSAGKKISRNAIVNFGNNRESAIRYMMTPKEYERLLTSVQKRKEHWYDGKETV